MATFDSVRVHAIILTQDRISVLERSVDTAVSTLGRYDILTVLDDSTDEIAEENALLLTAVARKSPTVVTHLLPARLYETVSRVTCRSARQWESRTARRDIAPLRNLALLLSAAVSARTTILIDDDICEFDLELTHEHLSQLTPGPQGLIVGAKISANQRWTQSLGWTMPFDGWNRDGSPVTGFPRKFIARAVTIMARGMLSVDG